MPGRAARCTALFLIWRPCAFCFVVSVASFRCALPPPRRPSRPSSTPYQHFALTIDRDTFAVRLPPAGVKTLTWAFAVGECGAETWNGIDAQKVADANVAAFARAGIGYILATGGEGGVFTCGSDAGMAAFIARYASPQLIGIDFDIEARQTPEQIDALLQRAVAARAK